jgi:hypothetical protein
MRKSGFPLRVVASLLVAFLLAGNVAAQKKKDDEAPPPGGIDAATGKILTEAIEGAEQGELRRCHGSSSQVEARSAQSVRAQPYRADHGDDREFA